jgi:hypothetical protein
MPCVFWVLAGRFNVYRYVIGEAHCHDIGCTQFGLCSAMETRGCTVRDVITALWWKEMTLVTTDAIWKRKQLPKSRYKTHLSSSYYSYHDATQRAANSSYLPPLHSCVKVGLNVGVVLRHPWLCVEKLNNYWLLLILIFVFAVYKRTLLSRWFLLFVHIFRFHLL